jgi:hypothetical protein
VAEHRGDTGGARAALLAAERYWQDADPDLPELKLARAPRTAER